MAQNQPAKGSPTPSNNKGANKTSVIAHGTVIKGNFKANDNLRIDGKIVGDVVCEKRLVIGKTGIIKGKIIAAELAVDGMVDGEAISKGVANLSATSQFVGTLTAVRLEVNEGATFNGEFKIGKK